MLLVILLSVSSASWADGNELIEIWADLADGELIESWRCFELYSDTKSLLTLSRYQGGPIEYGVIHLPGVEPITTFFAVNGLHRRWNWEHDATGDFRYSVVIFPDGLGAYFDFKAASDEAKTASPLMLFQCEKVG